MLLYLYPLTICTICNLCENIELWPFVRVQRKMSGTASPRVGRKKGKKGNGLVAPIPPSPVKELPSVLLTLPNSELVMQNERTITWKVDTMTPVKEGAVINAGQQLISSFYINPMDDLVRANWYAEPDQQRTSGTSHRSFSFTSQVPIVGYEIHDQVAELTWKTGEVVEGCICELDADPPLCIDHVLAPMGGVHKYQVFFKE